MPCATMLRKLYVSYYVNKVHVAKPISYVNKNCVWIICSTVFLVVVISQIFVSFYRGIVLLPVLMIDKILALCWKLNESSDPIRNCKF